MKRHKRSRKWRIALYKSQNDATKKKKEKFLWSYRRKRNSRSNNLRITKEFSVPILRARAVLVLSLSTTIPQYPSSISLSAETKRHVQIQRKKRREQTDLLNPVLACVTGFFVILPSSYLLLPSLPLFAPSRPLLCCQALLLS
ncbi:hypothetical protein, unlikely [Trypanosoma brucei gambiense DAL972]|uniref:Uncharacterized protein n=1 Tax=Trypanosoma brucei gambiense (strain MHOM/CI/86/DAL972) TaxID=679716 RepID=C9ZP36_TRYB9|nr:hypothetical protein, unlikely [Trypanosoma brucei gambiense DAL972]CBH11164.1 hypothetical protein, unlikely [Trypanosoma brucei gambiense DAL972]|eukprot:XP_011773451.1 hypothetical protein, unlikely [Trypanosoma brucei gambiense DAL972]